MCRRVRGRGEGVQDCCVTKENLDAFITGPYVKIDKRQVLVTAMLDREPCLSADRAGYPECRAVLGDLVDEIGISLR